MSKEQPRISRSRKHELRKQAEVEVELEDRKRKRAVVFGVLAVVFLVFFVYFGFTLQREIAKYPLLASTFGFFYTETTSVTIVGLFIVILLDTLFFVIFPGELYFFLALANGMDPLLAIAAASAGGFLGQVSNYWMGRYARRKGKDRPRGARLIRFAEKANGRGGTTFIAIALATPSPEIIGFAYGLGNFPAKRFAQIAAVCRTIKWISLFIAFIYLRQYLAVFGI